MKKLNLLAVGSLAMLMSLTTVNAASEAETAFTNCLAGEETTCKLTANLENIDSYFTISRDVTIDLAGHKITRTSGSVIFNVTDGNVKFTGNGTVDHSNESGSNAIIVSGDANVTIENGTFKSTGNGIIIQGEGTNIVTINNGEITGTKFGIVVAEDKTGNIVVNDGTIKGESGIAVSDGEGKSTIEINGGTITATKDNGISLAGTASTLEINKGTITGVYGVGVFGTNCTATIKNGTITAEAFAVSGNGSQTNNSTINIEGGTLESTDSAAIYHPQTGNLTISGGDITGKIGIVARQGTIKTTGGTITATGTGEDVRVGDACENGKTCNEETDNYVKLPQGVAVIVDNHLTGAYTNKATVDIEDGEFVVPEGNSTAVDYENATEDKNIAVKGGTFIAGEEADKTILTFVDNSENENLGQSDSGVIGTLHKVTFEEPENGTIEVPTNAAEGETITITVEPAEGFKVSKVLVNGTPIEPNDDGTYTYEMKTVDVKVTAEFIKIETSGDVPATTPDDETTGDKTEEETPNTLDKAPIYLTVGAVALTSVTALGYMVKKKLED